MRRLVLLLLLFLPLVAVAQAPLVDIPLVVRGAPVGPLLYPPVTAPIPASLVIEVAVFEATPSGGRLLTRQRMVTPLGQSGLVSWNQGQRVASDPHPQITEEIVFSVSPTSLYANDLSLYISGVRRTRANAFEPYQERPFATTVIQPLGARIGIAGSSLDRARLYLEVYATRN